MKRRLQSVAIVALSLVSLSASGFIAVNWSKLSAAQASVATGGHQKSARKPSSAAGQIAAEGRRDILIKRAIDSRSEELQACYNELLQRVPAQAVAQDAQGSMKLSWVVDPAGQVNSLNLVDSEVRDPEFNDCVLARVRDWKFRAAQDTPSFLVSHTFTFRPKAGTGLELEASNQ